MNDAGKIEVRFTVANAEVVRQALANLGKDGEKALKQFDASAQPANKSMLALSDIVEQIKGKAAGLAAEGGSTASVLMKWGPAGIAAGAALGGVYLALSNVVEISERFAGKAQGFRDTAAALELTTTQFQAIVDAGGKVGITSEQVAQGLSRVGAGAREARDAQGALFDTVRKVSPELANQLLVARDTAKVVDILAQAYQRATNSGDRLAIAKLMGKDAAFPGLLQQINAAGGVVGLTQAFSPEAVPQSTIDRVAKIKVEIDQINERTATLWGEAFSGPTLEAQKKSAEFWNEIAQHARDFTLSSDMRSYMDWARVAMAVPRGLTQLVVGPKAAEDVFGPAPDLGSALQKYGLERQRASLQSQIVAENDPAKVQKLTGELEKVNTQLAQYAKLRVTITKPADDVPLPQARPADAGPGASGDGNVNAAAQLNLFRERIALLGQAATPQEQYELHEKEIAAAVAKGGVAEETATRARIAAWNAKNQVIALTRTRLGVISEEQMLASRMADLDDQQAKGFIRNAEERAAAERIVRKEVKDAADAMALRGSSTPALTQLSQEAGDLTKQLDNGLAGSLRGIGSEFSLLNQSGDTVAQKLSNIALRFADVALQAAIMNSIVRPAASGLASLFGGFSIASIFGGGSAGDPTGSADGNVFQFGRIQPFAKGGILNGPMLFPMANGAGLAGEAGPEAIIPLSRDGKGRLGVNMSGASGGGHSFVYSPTIDARNSAAGETARLAGIIARDRKDFEKNMRKVIAGWQSSAPLVISG